MKIKYRNIAVSGAIGTGKSTLAHNLAKKLGFKVISSGEFFRKWHKENNLPLENSDQIPPEIDREIDMKYQSMMKKENGYIFESHLAGWLARDMEDVFSVLCLADKKIRIGRAAQRDGVSFEEAERESDSRAFAHQKKFKKLYDIDDRFDPEYFDLVVDTTTLSPEEVLGQVLEKLES